MDWNQYDNSFSLVLQEGLQDLRTNPKNTNKEVYLKQTNKKNQHQVYHRGFAPINLYKFTFPVCRKFQLLAHFIHSPFLFRPSDAATNSALAEIAFRH